MAVSLSRKNRIQHKLVYRLVASAFLGTLPEKRREEPLGAAWVEVNHRNGDKSDNQVENLEIVSRPTNLRHALQTGLMDNRGERNPMAKLTAEKVRAIRSRYEERRSYKAVAAEFGCSWGMVRNIVKGRSWRHVS